MLGYGAWAVGEWGLYTRRAASLVPQESPVARRQASKKMVRLGDGCYS